jgi:hypothetical protein
VQYQLINIMGHKHFMTVNCLCGTTYSVNVPTVPINCRIKNISMGGFGFIALNRVWVQLGDILNDTFALDKKPPEIVEKSHFPYN